jgi:hypothetical protein
VFSLQMMRRSHARERHELARSEDVPASALNLRAVPPTLDQ